MTEYIKNYNTWIELSKSAYKNNIDFFKNLTKNNTEIAAVIKANAYGHGMVEIATLATENNIKTFCVHSIKEAIKLRENNFNQKIILLGPVPIARMNDVIKYNLSTVAYNVENLRTLNEAAKKTDTKAKIHLKIETGTNRQGVTEYEIDKFLDFLKNYPNIRLEAVYSHFANIEDTTNHNYADYQYENYLKIVKIIEEKGFKNFKKHFASSAASILFQKTHFDMIRLGISQYGLWPSTETFVSFKLNNADKEKKILKPVLTWKTRISQIKDIKAGKFIGYGCTYQTTRNSKIAILPIGYSDGYDRLLSNQGYVIVNEKRAPIRGRIAMNLTVIDITDIYDAVLENEVILLGRQGAQEIAAENIASLTNTINYDVVTKISPYIKRIITD